MPEQITEPLTDEELRQLAEDPWAVWALPQPRSMAVELLAARAEIAALRNDLDAKRSDFEAAMEELAKADARRAELRRELEMKLARNRTTATRTFDGGEYRNPARKGYDVALVEVLALLGVDARERKTCRA